MQFKHVRIVKQKANSVFIYVDGKNL